MDLFRKKRASVDTSDKVVLGMTPLRSSKTCSDATDKDLYSETSVGILCIDEHPQLNPSRVSIVLEGSVVMEELANLPQAFCVLFGLIYALHLDYPKATEENRHIGAFYGFWVGKSCWDLATYGSRVLGWTKEMTEMFIRVRAENDVLFTGAKFSASTACRTILEKLDLQEVVTPLQACKKWNNLKKKYKDCKCPGTGQGVEGNPTAGTWPWFGLMDEVLGQKPSINPPVLIASIPDARPGPSQAREQEPEQEEEEPEAEQQRGTRRKRRASWATWRLDRDVTAIYCPSSSCEDLAPRQPCKPPGHCLQVFRGVWEVDDLVA
uniref:Myb/SANT-like DNA-binding domain-containing protein n=1 Tax=Knipowitschia caucasica TaxID=637954 RepID=A0AAV2MHN2_KNICA